MFYDGGKEIEINSDDIESLGNLFISDVDNLKSQNIPENIIKEYLEYIHARR